MRFVLLSLALSVTGCLDSNTKKETAAPSAQETTEPKADEGVVKVVTGSLVSVVIKEYRSTPTCQNTESKVVLADRKVTREICDETEDGEGEERSSKEFELSDDQSTSIKSLIEKMRSAEDKDDSCDGGTTTIVATYESGQVSLPVSRCSDTPREVIFKDFEQLLSEIYGGN